MDQSMRVAVLALLLAGLVLLPGEGQPFAQLQVLRPTAEQIKITDVEVPRLVTLLGLEPGTRVADVGAGLGAWTLRFSRWTGSAGHVYATDIGDVQLASLRDLVAREALSNVTVMMGAADSTSLPPGCCDAIVVRNVYHYFTEPAAMVRSFAASLKPGGRLAVVDFPPRPNSPLPPGVPANRGGNGVPPEIVEREVGVLFRHIVTVPNWSPESVPEGIPPEIGRPYVAIFEKAD
jgi:SAM-dependent methyltransferase